MKVIDGKAIAEDIVDGLRKQRAPGKIVAAVMVGENPASESFVRRKKATADALGVDLRIYRFPETGTNDSLRREIGRIAAQSRVGAVVVQLPLPAHVNAQYVLNAVPAEKDPDVLGERALGAFHAGRGRVLPPAVAVCEELFRREGVVIEEKKVVVVGLGMLVGRPAATWAMKRAKEVYALDKASDLAIVNQADIVISGVGKAGLIRQEMLGHGASVIDFGYSFDAEGNIRGDFEPVDGTVDASGAFYTPTPGGTGPILVAKLFENVYRLEGK